MKKTTSLEEMFLFRLIKVIYSLALIAGIFLVAVFGWYSKPEKYTTTENSFITCSDGKKYSLSTVSVYPLSSEKKLDTYDTERASEFCTKNIGYEVFSKSKNETQTITYSQLPFYGLSSSQYTDAGKFTYNLIPAEHVRGSWQTALLWWIGGFLGVYVVLNLTKETLIYIFFGRSFQWDWLKKIFNFLK